MLSRIKQRAAAARAAVGEWSKLPRVVSTAMVRLCVRAGEIAASLGEVEGSSLDASLALATICQIHAAIRVTVVVEGDASRSESNSVFCWSRVPGARESVGKDNEPAEVIELGPCPIGRGPWKVTLEGAPDFVARLVMSRNGEVFDGVLLAPGAGDWRPAVRGTEYCALSLRLEWAS